MHGSCWLRVKAEFLMNGLATSALIDSREAPGVCVYGSAVVCNSQDSTHWATGYVHNANKSHKRICSANCTYAVQKGGGRRCRGGSSLSRHHDENGPVEMRKEEGTLACKRSFRFCAL